MWPFRRKSVDLDEDSYGRWIRAQRPPLLWFLGQGDGVQESLALLGDEYMSEVVVALAQAFRDPEAAAAGLDAHDNPESEELLVRRLASDMIGRILQSPSSRPEASSGPNQMTMGGMGERRKENEARRKEQKNGSRQLFGRPPDREEG